MQVAIDCDDPRCLAAFWAEVLGYAVEPTTTADRSALFYAEGFGPSVVFHRVPEGKVIKHRVHLDVFVAEPPTTDETRSLVDAEMHRLVGLGATHLRTYDKGTDYFAVMQDPEGNEFCICG